MTKTTVRIAVVRNDPMPPTISCRIGSVRDFGIYRTRIPWDRRQISVRTDWRGAYRAPTVGWDTRAIAISIRSNWLSHPGSMIIASHSRMVSTMVSSYRHSLFPCDYRPRCFFCCCCRRRNRPDYNTSAIPCADSSRGANTRACTDPYHEIRIVPWTIHSSS